MGCSTSQSQGPTAVPVPKLFRRIGAGGKPSVNPERLAKGSAHLYEALIGSLDPSALGKGRDPRSTVPEHWASAYAVIGSAEACLLGVKDGGEHRQRIEQAGWWLINGMGCPTTGISAWGVPYARRIWNDETDTPPGTGMCVPTALALNALTDVYRCQAAPESLRVAALRAAEKSAVEFASTCFDWSGNSSVCFWYSVLPRHSYHVVNATALMTGQIQKTAWISNNPSLGETADAAVEYVLGQIRDENSNIWEGLYLGHKRPCGKKNRKNDLGHAAMICHGLLDYKVYGGRHGGEYDYAELVHVISRFCNGTEISEYADGREGGGKRNKYARVAGVGYALLVMARIEMITRQKHDRSLSLALYNGLLAYGANGRCMYERPGGERIRGRVRDIGNVLLGLAEFRRLVGAWQ